MITITVPQELEAALADMVRYTGQSAEQIALAALLEQLEDFEDLRISEARMSDNPQFFSMEEAMFRLGIDLEKDPTDS